MTLRSHPAAGLTHPPNPVHLLQCQYLHQQGIIMHKTLQNSSLLIMSSSLIIMGSDKYSWSRGPSYGSHTISDVTFSSSGALAPNLGGRWTGRPEGLVLKI